MQLDAESSFFRDAPSDCARKLSIFTMFEETLAFASLGPLSLVLLTIKPPKPLFRRRGGVSFAPRGGRMTAMREDPGYLADSESRSLLPEIAEGLIRAPSTVP